MPDLYRDYLKDAEALRPFFARPIATLGESAGGASHRWDPALRAEILEWQECLGLTREIPEDSSAIVTGQQPGLLTGPLYSIYKAITAIKLAEGRARATGRPCVPIFWVAADDHDFEEVRTAHLLTQAHASLPLTYTPAAAVAGHPMHAVPLEESLHALITQAANAVPGSELKGEIEDFLHASLDASTSFSEWFARLMARLFRDTPLILFTPELPTARANARPIFEQELHNPLASTRLLNEQGTRLAALGYPPQVVKSETECNFFLQFGPKRRKVLYENNAFVVPEENITLTTEHLVDLLDFAPEQFSANVVLRPLVQQHLLPTDAYVGGPGEIAYWAELRTVFDNAGLQMPVVYPRASATLTTIKLNKLLAKYDLTPSALAAPEEQLLQRALANTVKSPARAAFQQHAPSITQHTSALATALASLKGQNTPAAGLATTAQAQIQHALEKLERGLLRLDEAQVATVQSQIQRLRATFQPQGIPQERHYTLAAFLFEHGWGLIQRISDTLEITPGAENEIEL